MQIRGGKGMYYNFDENKKKILVVDDTSMTLRNIKSILDRKYEVFLATSGPQGLRFIHEKEPDLVLLDYQMPEMSGKEVFETMQADENMKDIPVVFLTGVDDKKTIMSVLQLKPAGYLLKPVDENKLLDTLEQILEPAGETDESEDSSELL